MKPLIAIGLAVAIGFSFFCITEDWNVVALMFTATLVAWYSHETYRLNINMQEANHISGKVRNEMIMANKISLAPGIVMEHGIVDHGVEKQKGFFLKNVGKGSAINIRIEEEAEDPVFNFELRGINTLGSGERAQVWIRKLGNNLDDREWNEIELRPLTVVISFDRIKEHKQLTTRLRISPPPVIEILETNWSL